MSKFCSVVGTLQTRPSDVHRGPQIYSEDGIYVAVTSYFFKWCKEKKMPCIVAMDIFPVPDSQR